MSHFSCGCYVAISKGGFRHPPSRSGCFRDPLLLVIRSGRSKGPIEFRRGGDRRAWAPRPDSARGEVDFRYIFANVNPLDGADLTPQTDPDPALAGLPPGLWADWGLDLAPRRRGDDSITNAAREKRPEDQLARLAAAGGPLRRLLAALAERLIATKAHERLCFARLADYARERPGLSARQLQELARVHRALAELPALERALVANELPWSKLRLLVRVASADDEQAWIARARDLPTRQLEAVVRDHARGEEAQDAEGEEPDTRIAVRCTPAVCEKWSLVREMAERMARGRLRAGDALELVVAEVSSSVSIDPLFVEDPGPSGRRCEGDLRGRETTPDPRAPRRELPPEIAALAAGLEDADPFELDRRLCLAVRLEQTLDAAIAPLLRWVTAPEFPWRGDYRPLSSYAREELGMSLSKARTLVRLACWSQVCPELHDAYRSGRLSWVKARCLLPLLGLDIDGEWRPAWVAWAEGVTVRRLEADVERAQLLRAGHHRYTNDCRKRATRTGAG